MKVSIRTAQRIVQHTEDKDSDPIFIPQYQEEGSDKWHNFTVRINGRGFGVNTVYFYTLTKAKDFLDLQTATEDVVVHYEDDESEWTKNLP
jgi:hypothetical protein